MSFTPMSVGRRVSVITHQPIFSGETLDRMARQRCPAKHETLAIHRLQDQRAQLLRWPTGLVAFFPNFEAENQGNDLTDTMFGIRITLKLGRRSNHPFQMFPCRGGKAYACQHS